MATIARRYQKKYHLLPRGKALYEDQDRFGTRMLKKMGWSEDKGLGANEDGSKEFVRVKYKNDSTGFGYEERDDQWTNHEESFSGLLKSLNGENDINSVTVSNTIEKNSKIDPIEINSESNDKRFKNKISGESLEEKSKTSKVRVHYKKFTRGKDVSRYSEKDLANIFGKKLDDSAIATEDKTQNEIKNQELEVENVLDKCSDNERPKKLKNPTLENQADKVQEEQTLLISAEEENSKSNSKKSKKRKRDTELAERDNIEKVKYSDGKIENILDNVLEDSNFEAKNEMQQQNYRVDVKNSESSVHYTKSKILEIFRHLDLDRFKGSNIKDIAGYGFTENFVIKLKKRPDDSQQITDVWIKAEERKKDVKYVRTKDKNVIEKIKKQKRQMIKKQKRKNLFQGI